MTPETRRMLCELSEAFGIPGAEDEVRALMARYLSPLAEVSYDRFGCIIARTQGSKAEPRVMLPAHMDEIGLIVRQITDEGFLRFVTSGGWWPQVMVSQRWTVRTRGGDLPAFSGARAPHLLTDEERGKPIAVKDMFLDIGARSKGEAMEMGVRPGDPVMPWSPVAELGGGRLLGKAWDDRVGCALIIETLRQLAERDHPNTVFAVGTTQEETGLHGAKTSAFAVEPQVAIVAEVTCANDVLGVTQDGSYCDLGKGPGICLRDSGMIPNRRLFEFMTSAAEEAGIPFQYVTLERGTTDGTPIQVHAEGVPSIYVGTPARYIHSHASIIDEQDFDQTVQLLVETVVRLDADAVAALTSYGG
jgi:putative aminopeptidase FrvX